jgi:hypothetical protein
MIHETREEYLIKILDQDLISAEEFDDFCLRTTQTREAALFDLLVAQERELGEINLLFDFLDRWPVARQLGVRVHNDYYRSVIIMRESQYMGCPVDEGSFEVTLRLWKREDDPVFFATKPLISGGSSGEFDPYDQAAVMKNLIWLGFSAHEIAEAMAEVPAYSEGGENK